MPAQSPGISHAKASVCMNIENFRKIEIANKIRSPNSNGSSKSIAVRCVRSPDAYYSSYLAFERRRSIGRCIGSIDRNEIIRKNNFNRPERFDRRTRTVYSISTRFAPLERPFFVVRYISSRASCARRRLETINNKMRIRGSAKMIFHFHAYVALLVVRWISRTERRRSAGWKEDKKWS